MMGPLLLTLYDLSNAALKDQAVYAALTKLEAAHRQLKVAIRMYFADDDLVAIHTLVGAAREIYEKHCKRLGITRFFDYVQQSHNQPENVLWNALNGPRNFLKHPGDTLDDEITLTDSDNSAMLFYACHDCAMLCGQDQPFEVSVFNAWYLGSVFPIEAGKQYREDSADLLDLMEQHYPSLRSAALDEQKRIGLQMLAELASAEQPAI